MISSLVISEIFGPTIQGEGPAAGRIATFVRLGGCNLTCGWCDTAYTWDAGRFDLRGEMTRLTVDEVAADVAARGDGLVVISGGEPLLQDRPGYGLARLANRFAGQGREVHIETNGTIEPGASLVSAVSLFAVSPKLPHSGVEASRAIKWPALRAFAALARVGRAYLKIVCRTREDIADAAALASTAEFPPGSAWVMPEGTTPAVVVERLRELTGPAIALGLNITSRQHVLTWGDERGH